MCRQSRHQALLSAASTQCRTSSCLCRARFAAIPGFRTRWGGFSLKNTPSGNMRIYRMEPPVSAPDPLPFVNRERALGIIATATLLGLLYFARDVLVPITLAVILSLLMAPLVRVLRRIGLGQTLSVLAAVLVFAFSFAAVAGVIGSQLVHMAQSLPRYERTIEHKLKTLNAVTVRRLNDLTKQAGRFANRPAASEPPGTAEPTRTLQQSDPAAPGGP